MGIKTRYDILNQRLDRKKYLGSDYEGRLFLRTMSNHMLYNPNLNGFLVKIEKIFYELIQQVKRIKTHRNFIVPRDYKDFN